MRFVASAGHTVSTDAITTFFAILAFACNAFVVGTLVLWLVRRRYPAAWETLVDTAGANALWLGALIAAVAMAGSLYLSEGAHFPPCRLCWYQRIAMYSLAVILVVAAIRNDKRAWPYPFTLALLALPISMYHVALEQYPSLETGACEVSNPCSIVWVRQFGVATIPYMAGSGFAAIAVAMLLARAALHEEVDRVEPSTHR